MKKIILCLIISIATFQANAQTGFHAGLNAGFNSIWIVNQNIYGYKELDYLRTFSIIPGAAFGYNFKDNLGVELQLNFAKLGQDYFDVSSSFSLADDGQGKRLKVETWRTVELSYLQIPILFRYQSIRTKKQIISYHLMVGPTIGLLLSADQKFEADVFRDGNILTLDNSIILDTIVSDFAKTDAIEPMEDYFSGLEIGVTADAGVDIYLNDNLYFTPAVKVYYGLTDLNSKPTRDVLSYAASHNFYGGIYLGIHYMFHSKDD